MERTDRIAQGEYRRAKAVSAALGLVVGVAWPDLASAQVAADWIEFTRGVSIAVDSADNVYTLDYEQNLGAEMTVTKRDVDGNLVWTASYDQTEPTKWERAAWIATDGADDVIVVGTLMSGYSNPVTAASIAMKFDPSGALVWRRVYESSFDGSYVKKCLVDRDDNVYVLGVGSGPPGYVTKIVKFAPDGTALWSYFDAAGIGAPTNFKLTPDDHLVVTGRGITGSINGYAKLDLDGNEVWSMAGVQSLTVGDCAGDVFGNTYAVHGEYVTGSPGTVVKKLDPSGALVWENVYPSSGFRIEVGNDDRAVVSGFPNSGTPGAAFFKVSQSGALVWSNLDADGPLGLLLHAHMLMDPSGDAYLAAGTLFDMAVCKVESDGTSLWTATTAGGYANAIALARTTNSVFVVGGRTARLLDATEGAWQDLGQGLTGTDGEPVLAGQGILTQGDALTLYVRYALPSTFGVHVIGLSAPSQPFLGGTLVPALDAHVFKGTSPMGRAKVSGAVEDVIPPGTKLWFQSWFVDASGPQLFSASNAVVVTAP